MRHYGQVVVAAASMTSATCRTKRDKPSNYVGDWNGGTVVQACSQTNRPINQLVRLHKKASAGHDPITSRHNSTKHLVTSVPPGEQHRGCCTATEGRVRRRSVRSARLDVLPVLRRQGQTHPRQHLEHSAVVRPSHVCHPSAPWTSAAIFRTSDHRRGSKATVHHATQIVTARCIAVSGSSPT